MGKTYDFIRRIFSRDARIAYHIAKLKDEDAVVRGNAAGALGRIGDFRAVPALVDALNDKDWFVRWQAALALGWIKDVKTIPALVNALKDEDTKVRGQTAWALEELGLEKIGLNEKISCMLLQYEKKEEIVAIGKPAVPALVDALSDKDSDVWKNAAKALVKIIPNLRELEGLLMKALEKAEGEEKKKLLDLLDKINNRRNKILEPEVKKLKPPKIIKKRKKPKRRMWRAVQ